VAARARRLHGDVHVALLGDTDKSERPIREGEHAVGDGPALVEEKGSVDAARGQGLAGEPRAAGAAYLLVAAESEVDRPPRAEAVCEQALGRVKGADEGDFDILRASAPDAELGDIAGKGAVPPLLGVLGGHHVEVGAENGGTEPRRRECLARAFPGEEEGAVAYLLAPELGVDFGEEALEILFKGREGRIVLALLS